MLGTFHPSRQRRGTGLAICLAIGLCSASVSATAGDTTLEGIGQKPIGNLALAAVHGRGSDASSPAVAQAADTGVILWDEVWNERGTVNAYNLNQGIGNAQSVSLNLSHK